MHGQQNIKISDGMSMKF